MGERKVYLISINEVASVPNPPWDRNKLRRYRRALRRGAMFPPVDMVDRGGDGFEILDGSHRYNTHVRAYLDCERYPSPAALEFVSRSYARDHKLTGRKARS